MEELSGGKSRKKSKPSPRVATLETSVGRPKEHVLRLEKMLRLLENDVISVEAVQDVRDFVDDYIDRCNDAPDEFENPDDIYGDLVDVMDAQVDTTVNHLSAKEKEKEKKEEEKERERQKAAAAAAKAQLAAQGIGRLQTEEEKEKEKEKEKKAAAASASASPADKKALNAASDDKSVAPPPPPPPKKDGESSTSTSNPMSPVAANLAAPGTPVHAFAAVASGARTSSDAYPALGLGKAAGGAKPAVPPPAPEQRDPNRDMLSMPVVDEARLDSGLDEMKMFVGKMRLQDGIADKEFSVQQRLQMLQVSALRSIPQLSDGRWSLLSQRPIPSNLPVPTSYPSQKLALMAEPELFDRLDPETLLYAFSFEKGTIQQFLASRALGAKGWGWDDAVWRGPEGVWDPVAWRLA